MKNNTLIAVVLTGSSVLSHGAITYVDAGVSNTTIDSNAIVLGTNVTTSRINTDNLWAEEPNTGFGTNNNTVYAASNTEDVGTLETTVNVAAGTYNVYVFYWTGPSAQNWDLSSSVNGGATVNSTGGLDDATNVLASTLSYAADPSFTGGNRTLMAESLGTVSTTGSLAFTIDDLTGNANRSWYDGVGYEAVVVPEPSTALLGLLSLMGFAARRRR